MISTKRLIKCLFLLFLASSAPSTVRAMVPTAAAGVVAGATWFIYEMLWGNSQEEGEWAELNQPLIVGNSQCKGREIVLSEDGTVSIAQIKVLDQFQKEAGGDGSCGYQSLKNAIQMLFSLETGSSDLAQLVNDSDVIQQLFGKQGVWRNEIIRQRIMTAYRDFLSNRLSRCLRRAEDVYDEGFHPERLRSRYNTFLGNYCTTLVEEILRGRSVDVTFGHFINYLINNQGIVQVENARDFAPEHLDASPEMIQVHLCAPETVARYFDDTQLEPINIGLGNIHDVLADYNSRHPNRRLAINGEWIDETDIAHIVQLEPRAVGPDMFTTIGDMSLVRPCNQVLPEWQRIVNVLAALRSSCVREYIHCFILGTMRSQIREGSTVESVQDGHWLAALVHKQANQRRYIVADSTNCCRLYNDPIKRLIKILEGKEAAQKLRPSPDDLCHIENHMQLTMAKQNCPEEERHRLLDLHNLYRERGGTYEALGGQQSFLVQLTDFVHPDPASS